MRLLASLLLLATVAAAADPFPGWTVLDGRKTATGELVGEVEFGGRRARAMVHKIGNAWTLAFQPDTRRLSAIAPLVRGTIVDDLDLSSPVIVISHARTRARLSAEAARFFGVPSVDLEKGVNIVTSVRPSGAVQAALTKFGVDVPRVLLTGVLLRNFDHAELKKAKEAGKLKDALHRGTMLKAEVPSFRPRLPKGMGAGSAYLFVTGEPGIGVGFALTANGKQFGMGRRWPRPRGWSRPRPARRSGRGWPISTTPRRSTRWSPRRTARWGGLISW